MIKYIKITLLLIFTGSMGKAQSLTPQTLSNAGISSSNGNVLLEYSMGGFMDNSIGTATFLYTQGFLQPNAGTTNTPPYINNVALSTGSTLDVAGTTFINGGAMIEFTLGEVASITLSNVNRGSMLTQGILQPLNIGGVLPVTGLELFAKRINSTTVQLDWKTLTEINNKGFYAERRKDNENSFTSLGFVQSKALGGNSNFALDYQKTDNNKYAGKTYYRLKQEDLNGQYKYSDIRIVNGDNSVILQVWPVPSTGPVNVLVNGITTTDQLQVFDAAGKLVYRQNIQNNQPVQLTKMTAGTYIVRLAQNNDLLQKIIIQ